MKDGRRTARHRRLELQLKRRQAPFSSLYNAHDFAMPPYRNLSQSTVILCIQVNEKSCRLRKGAYRDGVKRKGDKIGMGV